jgi:hypothetical protein
MRSRGTSSTALDSCGCALGARFLAIALVVAIGWYAWQWRASALSLWQMALRVFIWAFVAATAGKGIGILLFKRRARRR